MGRRWGSLGEAGTRHRLLVLPPCGSLPTSLDRSERGLQARHFSPALLSAFLVRVGFLTTAQAPLHTDPGGLPVSLSMVLGGARRIAPHPRRRMRTCARTEAMSGRRYAPGVYDDITG